MNRSTLLGLPLLLALAGCGGSDSPVIAVPSTSPTASATPTASPTPTLPAGIDQQIALTIAKGTVTGVGDRLKVKINTTVQLVVTSDVADEIHLHGYDKMVDVAAGGTATLTVKASIPGVFELELESRKLVLTHLQVQ